MSSLNTKLSELDKLETDLAECMQSASKCLSELAKDKVIHRQVENHAQEFLKRIKAVENGIYSQITYLNQVGIGAAHEGAAYLATRERQAANDRTNFLHDRLTSAQKRVREREQQQLIVIEDSTKQNSSEPAEEEIPANNDTEMITE